jgi:hypothetical protein
MRKIFAALVAAITALTCIPAASASAPPPTWAKETGLPSNFTWGNWFTCRSDYQATDCIDSVIWAKSNGEKIQGIWSPNLDFNFEAFKQTWSVEQNGESAQDFIQSISQTGSFSFPGLVTPCGDSNIVIDVRPVRGGFQVNGKPTCGNHFQKLFEERFEVVLKSKNLKGFVGGVSSTGRIPRIQFKQASDGDTLRISANFAYTAWSYSSDNGVRRDVCKRNEFKADGGGWGFWNVIYWTVRNGDPWLATHPGDMISGTNGWNCGGAMYWDSQEQGLVMQVGSPHFDVDGSVIDGWFEGAIRGRYISERFRIAPNLAAGNARLEVVYNDGVRKVATITARYDSKSDWLYLSGYGFTYSNPKLVVKFAQKISCVKGKTIKSISGTKPVCPAGYKKR